jgi:hypothetical protein
MANRANALRVPRRADARPPAYTARIAASRGRVHDDDGLLRGILVVSLTSLLVLALLALELWTAVSPYEPGATMSPAEDATVPVTDELDGATASMVSGPALLR